MNICIVNCFDTWEKRVNMLYNVMTGAGHSVKVYTSDFRHIEKTRRFEEKKDFRFFTAEPYAKNMSFARMHSHIQLSRDIFECVERRVDAIDLLWVLAPPNSFVKDAADIKKNHPDLKLVIDIIDLWPETMPVGNVKKLPMFATWRNLRNDHLKAADMIVTECDLYREVLGSVIEGIPAKTICFAREDRGYTPKLHLPGDRMSLCYLGSINNIIDIDEIGNIVRQCEKKKPVILHIVGGGERQEELVRTCEAAGADVIDHGRNYDREEKRRIYEASHYGLNIMKSSVCVGLTMKSIEYLEFGLPIINNIRGDTQRIVDTERIGVNLPGDIIDYDPSMRLNARRYFEEHLSERAFNQQVSEVFEFFGEPFL